MTFYGLVILVYQAFVTPFIQVSIGDLVFFSPGGTGCGAPDQVCQGFVQYLKGLVGGYIFKVFFKTILLDDMVHFVYGQEKSYLWEHVFLSLLY